MSTSTATTPELPPIGDFNLYLDVLTHKDLRPTSPNDPLEWDDNERLAELGASVLNNVVTSHFFSKRPLVRADEIRTSREHYTSPTMLNSWLDNYKLKQKFRIPANLHDTVYDDLNQMAALFHSYVAAVFLNKGPVAVQTWITKLIDPEVKIGPLTQPGYSSHTQPENSDLSASTTAVPTSSSTASSLTIPVSLVNEVALLRGFNISYLASKEGEPHQLTWTMQCLINGVEKGRGVARTQKLAKEEAARQAWVAMGW